MIQEAVGVVVDDFESVFGCELDEPGLAGRAEGGSGGVVVAGDAVYLQGSECRV